MSSIFSIFFFSPRVIPPLGFSETPVFFALYPVLTSLFLYLPIECRYVFFPWTPTRLVTLCPAFRAPDF